MKEIIKISLIAVLFLVANLLKAQLYINEFLASNVTINVDVDFGDYSDWIEIYNDSEYPIDIAGYYLTDDLENQTRWQFMESTIIEAKGFLLIWADGNDSLSDNYANSHHTNFRLSKFGEEIGLYSPELELIDSVTFGYQFPDVSMGREYNGSPDFWYLWEPTPGNSNNTQGTLNREYTPDPEFSLTGGFFENSLSITLSCSSPGAVIRYTLDCSRPTSSSPMYSSEIIIESNTIIRATAFEPGILPSAIITQSYFINEENNDLPVISLAAFPETLWDPYIGIYATSRKGVEIPVNFEIFDTSRVQQLSITSGLRLSGQASFDAPQKPFTISTKGKYGPEIFDYQLFKNRKIANYEDLYLRTSGTPDIFYTMFRDGMTHSLVINKASIDCQAYQPSSLFLNGEYWGIYNMRDKIVENYFAKIHRADPDNLDILEYLWSLTAVAVSGSVDEFNALINYLNDPETDLSLDEHYEYINSKVDINEFIDYQITQIFAANADWVYSNVKWWREKTFDGKWRWVLLDTDVSFGMQWEQAQQYSNYYDNTLAWALLPAFSNTNLIFRKLMENESCRNEFIQRFAAHLNSTFHTERVLYIIDSLKANIESEMPRHINRWKDYPWGWAGEPIQNMDEWNTDVEIMREFAMYRPGYQRQHIMDYFGITDTSLLTTGVSETFSGRIFINNVEITDSSSTGVYFNNIPVNVMAIPNAGFTFTGWSGLSQSENPEISVILTGDTILTALFEPNNVNMVLRNILMIL